MHCEPEVVGRLHLGNAVKLPFPDNSFKAVISLNTIHNLERADLHHRLEARCERLAPGRGFVQVDSYRTPEQKAMFEEWVLTAKFHDYPDGWVEPVQGGRLHRRLLLDDHRVGPVRERKALTAKRIGRGGVARRIMIKVGAAHAVCARGGRSRAKGGHAHSPIEGMIDERYGLAQLFDPEPRASVACVTAGGSSTSPSKSARCTSARPIPARRSSTASTTT